MVAPHEIDMGAIWDGWAGQWARIRPYQSYAAQQRIEQAAFQASMHPTAGESTPEVDVNLRQVEAAVAWVEEQVVEWHLLDYEGDELQPNRAGVTGDMTPADLIDQLIGAMSDYYEAQRPPIFRAASANPG